jgi:hypothetical protein
MTKTRSELHTELENLEKQLREVRKTKKSIMTDYKDQIKDVESSIEQVLKDLAELSHPQGE